MERKTALVSDETYHIFNRGAHRQAIFTGDTDKDRFLLLLYLFNASEPVVMRDVLAKYKGRSYGEAFVNEKPEQRLVDILAFALMTNHFHLVLRQLSENGISQFMKKLCTSYSMYFNEKYEHSGTLFQGRFRSNHIDTEAYFRWIFTYVHLNPIEIVDHNWKRGVKDKDRVRQFMAKYKYSSFYDYSVGKRQESMILAAQDTVPDFLHTQNDLEELLSDYSRGKFIYSDSDVA